MDETKCKEGVWDGWHKYQCSRKIWKDGYCKQHHPESVHERTRKANERYEAKQAKSPWNLLAKANARIKELEAESKEFCICAAVMDETRYVWRGHRHSDCIQLVIQARRLHRESMQGFVTSKGRFVNRQEGYKLQVAAGIESASGGYRGEKLFSEDLY